MLLIMAGTSTHMLICATYFTFVVKEKKSRKEKQQGKSLAPFNEYQKLTLKGQIKEQLLNSQK